MSAIAEYAVAASVVGYILVSVLWLLEDGSWWRLGVRLLSLGAVVFALNILFSFPQFLRNTAIPKSESAESVFPLLVLYTCMLTGMLAQHLHERFSAPARSRAKFDWGVFLAPIFLSPMVFVPLYATMNAAPAASNAKYMLFLIAFENGFFFKQYYEQRRLHHAESNRAKVRHVA